MAQIVSRLSDNPEGELVIEGDNNFQKIYFIPPKEAMQNFGEFLPSIARSHILDINHQKGLITMYPIKVWSFNCLDQKYPQLKAITCELRHVPVKNDEDVKDLLEELPKQFTRNYNYGLGFLQEFRHIAKILEKFGVEHLILNRKDKTSIDEANKTFTLNYSAFLATCKAIKKITRESQTKTVAVKELSVNNHLAYFLSNEKYPQKTFNPGNSTLAKLIGHSTTGVPLDLDIKEQKEAVDLVTKNSVKILRDQPEQLVKLRNDIELATLEQLINKFKDALTKKLPEPYWQKLFNINPFILNLAFGYPIMKVREQAYVGGRKLSGSGEKITDFLVKNSSSNNLALFEIKTPTTKILNASSYRNNVFSPSNELAGATNQLLDQIYKLQKEIALKKENERIYDIETYAVHGILIVGMFPTEDEKKKSFELYRGNSKNITIVTFDELLIKLEQLHTFLKPTPLDEKELPF